MLLQPSMLVAIGSDAPAFCTRVKRWFEPSLGPAFGTVPLRAEDDFVSEVGPVIAQLRSARLISQLTQGGFVPQGHFFRNFRTLIVCHAEDSGMIDRVRDAVKRSLEQQPFGEAIQRQFWVIVLGPDTIPAIQPVTDSICDYFGQGEAATILHILPYWQANVLNPVEMSAVAERLAVLLLHMDVDPQKALVQVLMAPTRRASLVGLEGHQFLGLDAAVEKAIGKAVSQTLAEMITGARMPSTLQLWSLVRTAIPSFDSDAPIDRLTEAGRDLRKRYLSRYIPELLNSLAQHVPDVESLLAVLSQLESETDPKRAVAANAVWTPLAAFVPGATFAGWQVAVAGAAVAVIAALVWKLRKRNVGPPSPGPTGDDGLPPVQPLGAHAVFHSALQEVIAGLSGLEKAVGEAASVATQTTTNVAGHTSEAAPIVTDTITAAQCTQALVDAAKEQLRASALNVSQLLAIDYLKNELTPSRGFHQVIAAVEQLKRKLRDQIAAEWLANAKRVHDEHRSDWRQFVFAPVPPGSAEKVFELAHPSKSPQHAGWYPLTWLHYLYLVQV